ncbi:MAG: methyltransferase domain-containing protein [Desulfobacterales bacterium]|jgi:SAM-dependent methyltransferase
MLQERLKWNERYRKERCPQDPSTIVKQYAHLAHGKKALDIAAGNGRNSLFLADQGFDVDAIDIADAGLSLFSGKHSRIHTICADFDHYDIPANRYDLIANIKFLNRRLFPYIKAGLKPGGILIFQTFLDSSDPPRHPQGHADFYLRENELLHAFLSLKILLYSETEDEKNGETNWLASLVASRIC